MVDEKNVCKYVRRKLDDIKTVYEFGKTNIVVEEIIDFNGDTYLHPISGRTMIENCFWRPLTEEELWIYCELLEDEIGRKDTSI